MHHTAVDFSPFSLTRFCAVTRVGWGGMGTVKDFGRCYRVKVAPYSFLTARELVSKSRDGASFKKSTRKSRATSTTASSTGRILATIVAHFQFVSHL